MFKIFTGTVTRRPSHLLLLAALLTFVLSLFLYNEQLDLHLYDTYIVTPLSFWLWPVALAFAIIALLYECFRRFLPSKILSWLHVGFTLTTMPIAILEFYWYQAFLSPAMTFVINRPATASVYQYEDQLFFSSMIITTQLLFVVHLIYGVITYFLKKRTL